MTLRARWVNAKSSPGDAKSSLQGYGAPQQGYAPQYGGEQYTEYAHPSTSGVSGASGGDADAKARKKEEKARLLEELQRLREVQEKVRACCVVRRRERTRWKGPFIQTTRCDQFAPVVNYTVLWQCYECWVRVFIKLRHQLYSEAWVLCVWCGGAALCCASHRARSVWLCHPRYGGDAASASSSSDTDLTPWSCLSHIYTRLSSKGKLFHPLHLVTTGTASPSPERPCLLPDIPHGAHTVGETLCSYLSCAAGGSPRSFRPCPPPPHRSAFA